MAAEELLEGGNASGCVVRVGDTVRKPWLPTTRRTVEFLECLHGAGVDVPRTFGRDEVGRLVLEFIPGQLAMDVAPLPAPLVARVGSLVRRIHDASSAWPVPADWPEGLLPAPTRELICHNDLATWNLVIDGDRLVFIDWDGAAPSSRSWDLAYAATSFGHLFPGSDVTECEARVSAFFTGYRPTAALQAEAVGLLAPRAMAMYELLHSSHASGLEPWASMFVEGHGDHWLATAAFITTHQDIWANVPLS